MKTARQKSARRPHPSMWDFRIGNQFFSFKFKSRPAEQFTAYAAIAAGVKPSHAK
jgi:hypothetical protein